MKLIRSFLIVLAGVITFWGCQKELSYDGGTSEGTLKKDASGNCLPITVYGQYKKDTLLTAANYIDVQVNMTIPGTYDIRTDTVNGFSFKGTGTLGNPGLNIVRLYGTGKPTATGNATFIVKYGTSSCNVTINVSGTGGIGLATFTLGGSPGSCTGALVSGSFVAGTAINTTNTIAIEVNVTTPGAFAISTVPANGMTFAAAGSFSTTGVQVVILNGVGTPAAAGINNLSVAAPGSSCTISVTTQPAGTAASFTLGGAPGNCTGAVIAGTYTAGTALAAANTATIDVNVTAIGTYLIATTMINGMQFAATGTFTATGPQTVTLTGTGTPAVGGNFNLPATGGGGSCTFSVTVTGSAGSAAYTLNGQPGSCSGAVANGTYTAGTPVGSTNSATLNVTVTTAGTYSISTTTVNGISFAASGTFAGTGTQQVTLQAMGTPTAAGTDNFPATGGGTTCTFSITTAGTGSAATYTLGGAPGNCTGAVTNGTYTAGTILTAANTVILDVNVTVTGTYSISTPSNNGVVFSKTGSFTVTGPQTVTLNGTGTPTLAGNFNYLANGAASSCTFSVTVNPGGAVNNDYFPLTQNSYWSYNLVSQGTTDPDTLYKVSGIQAAVGGNTYRNFDISFGGPPPGGLARYRKSGSDYYERILVDTFSLFEFDTPQFGEILFLKEASPINTVWDSPEFTGTTLGTPLKMKYSFKIESTGGTLTVNGVTYNNVTKVFWKCLTDLANTGYTDDLYLESWYARGVGLIKFRQWDSAGAPTDDQVENLRYYTVF